MSRLGKFIFYGVLLYGAIGTFWAFKDLWGDTTKGPYPRQGIVLLKYDLVKTLLSHRGENGFVAGNFDVVRGIRDLSIVQANAPLLYQPARIAVAGGGLDGSQ